jgi:hypothetical protein
MELKDKLIIAVISGIVLGIIFIFYVKVTCNCNTLTLTNDNYGVHRIFGLIAILVGIYYSGHGWGLVLISLGIADIMFHTREYMILSKC